MKQFSKIIAIALSIFALYTSCKKFDIKQNAEVLPVYLFGTSPVLTSSTATVTQLLADSNNVIETFTWSNPKYSTDSNTIKYILDIDSSGKNFSKPVSITVIGDLNKKFTGRELNAVLLKLGFKLGIAQAIDVRVISSYNNNNEKYTSNVVKVIATPFADPAKLYTQNTTVTGTLANALMPSNTFTWEQAFKGYEDSITYTLQYDSAGKNFVVPIEIIVGASILNTTLTQGEMNQTALSSGIIAGTTGKVEYRIKAVTAKGATVYSNIVNVVVNTYISIIRMYLPGSYQTATGNGTDWTPSNAPELIRDVRSNVFNNLYYIYIYLPAGTNFKITEGAAWTTAFGTGSSAGSVTSNNGGNFGVTNAGYYRISINRTNLTYDISAGRMGFVGGATPTGWNPPGVFPSNAMANAGTNLFIGVTTFSSGGWKLIDNNQWDNGSASVNETRSYGSTGGDGSTLQVNGANFNDFATAGRNRLIWDGRDVNNIKYNTTPATEMRVVGDGMNMAGVNDWDPPTSPQMTYAGNGVWTRIVTLKANKEIKFLAGANWGAFDYEDNSGQNQAIGVAKKIQWENGPNFKTPITAGTYTITLNENNQTVTIN